LDELFDTDVDDLPGQVRGGDPADLAEASMAVERSMARRQRIRRIQNLLATPAAGHRERSGAVYEGCIVTIRYQGDTEDERLLLCELDGHADTLDVVTPFSPLGKALLGAHPGEDVRYDAPCGQLALRIVAVE
jgi:transcription elongation factor GreA